jgi:S-adenosylmethionine:tRNA ribosyltransferase-isomerase
LEKNLWEVLVKPARKVRIGNKLHIPRGINCDVIDNTVSGGRVLRFDSNGDFYKVIDEIGECPLPPYIKRKADSKDKERYQTVYAKNRGAVAAPTAGLHFTKDLLERIRKKKIKIVYVTVHIGLGTFRPVQVEDLARHRMDSEFFEVPWDTVQTVNETMKNGKKIFAVGTSVVRALESVVDANGVIKPMKGWTDKFIYPPYEFKIVDGVITNFHLPYSTLLMLVCAFAGREYIYKAYKQAIKEKYRFYSYGDAMLIL